MSVFLGLSAPPVCGVLFFWLVCTLTASPLYSTRLPSFPAFLTNNTSNLSSVILHLPPITNGSLTIEINLWRTVPFLGTFRKHPKVLVTVHQDLPPADWQCNGQLILSITSNSTVTVLLNNRFNYSYHLQWCSPSCPLSCPVDNTGAYCNGFGACMKADSTTSNSLKCFCDTVDGMPYKLSIEPNGQTCVFPGLNQIPIWIAIGVCTFIICVAAVCGIYYYIKQQDKEPEDEEQRAFLQGNIQDDENFAKNTKSQRDLVEKEFIRAEDIELGKVVGSGSFSIVHEGTWKGEQVAVKVIKGVEPSLREYILGECAIMVALDHPNIVKYMGACLDPATRFFIVTEYLERGSLSKLVGDKSVGFDLEHMRGFLKDTAEGMQYLHSKNIIHRDLKPGNLLVTNDWRVKVADFGLSRALPNAHLTQTLTSCGTITYTAPEVLRDQRYSLKADVWSFGIIALSLLTRSKPYPNMTDAQVVIRVLGGKKPKISSKLPKDFQKLIKGCFENDAKLRPAFTVIVEYLERMVLPKPFSEHPYPAASKPSNVSSKTFSSSVPTRNPHLTPNRTSTFTNPVVSSIPTKPNFIQHNPLLINDTYSSPTPPSPSSSPNFLNNLNEMVPVVKFGSGYETEPEETPDGSLLSTPSPDQPSAPPPSTAPLQFPG